MDSIRAGVNDSLNPRLVWSEFRWIKLSLSSECSARPGRPVPAGDPGAVRGAGDVPAEAEELPHDDGGGQGVRVGGRQGQGGHAPPHGAPLRIRYSTRQYGNSYFPFSNLCSKMMSRQDDEQLGGFH